MMNMNSTNNNQSDNMNDIMNMQTMAINMNMINQPMINVNNNDTIHNSINNLNIINSNNNYDYDNMNMADQDPDADADVINNTGSLSNNEQISSDQNNNDEDE